MLLALNLGHWHQILPQVQGREWQGSNSMLDAVLLQVCGVQRGTQRC